MKNRAKLREVPLTSEQRFSLMTRKFEEINFLEENRAEVYRRLTEEEHVLYDDTLEVISKLRKNYKLAIVSNMYGISGERIRKLFPNFLNNFDVITFSAEIGIVKPDLQIFLHTLGEFNKNGEKIKPIEVVMIGDKVDKDVMPPRVLGMNSRLISRNFQKLEDVV